MSRFRGTRQGRYIHIEVGLWTRFPKLLLTTAYQLYSYGVPRAAENIGQLCMGEHWWVLQTQKQTKPIFLNQDARRRNGKGSTPLGYNNSTFHRFIKVFKPGVFNFQCQKLNGVYWPFKVLRDSRRGLSQSAYTCISFSPLSIECPHVLLCWWKLIQTQNSKISRTRKSVTLPLVPACVWDV